MLKRKITPVEFAALADHLKTEYKESGGAYLVDLDEAWPDVTGLKTALEHEKQHRLTATGRVTALEGELATAKAAASGDTKALDESYKKKLDDKDKEHKAALKTMRSHVERVLVDDVISNMAKEISTDPDLMLPHLKGRIKLEETGDGQFITRVLDEGGQPSALSVNEFKQFIVDNPKFAKIVVASKASGGGASGSQQKPNAGGKKLSEMSESEKVKLYKENRPEFDRLSKAEK